MSNKHPLQNNHTRTIVVSCIALVIGILLCCSVSLGELLSWFIGIAISLCGVMYLLCKPFRGLQIQFSSKLNPILKPQHERIRYEF